MADILKKSDVILFFAEAFKRWGAKSPKYFRIWRTINAILCAIGASGITLTQVTSLFPGIWAKIIFSVIAGCGAYGAAMTTLPVSKPVDLPLTEKKQIEEGVK